jgi:hypothetical protein
MLFVRIAAHEPISLSEADLLIRPVSRGDALRRPEILHVRRARSGDVLGKIIPNKFAIVNTKPVVRADSRRVVPNCARPRFYCARYAAPARKTEHQDQAHACCVTNKPATPMFVQPGRLQCLKVRIELKTSPICIQIGCQCNRLRGECEWSSKKDRIMRIAPNQQTARLKDTGAVQKNQQ